MANKHSFWQSSSKSIPMAIVLNVIMNQRKKEPRKYFQYCNHMVEYLLLI